MVFGVVRWSDRCREDIQIYMAIIIITFNQMKTETEVIAPSLIITNNPLLIFQATTIFLNYSEVTEVYHDHNIIG